MKKLVMVIPIIIAILISGCTKQCEHEWVNATCDTPVTCKLCGVTAGEPVRHRWKDVDCTNPKTCEVCGLTEGEHLGHQWKDATCTEAKTCKICGATEGEPIGHKWKEATYDSPKTCSVCGETEGKALAKPAQTQPQTSIQTPTPTRKTCLICGYTVTRSDTQYCGDHDCAKTGCPYPAKHIPGSYGSFCEIHSCIDLKCTSERTNDSNYCSAHKH